MNIIDFSLRRLVDLYSLASSLTGDSALLLFPSCRLAVPRSEIHEATLNYAHIFIYKDYERFEEFRAGSSERVVDIGGYLGLYSVKNLKAGKRVKVTVVEANPALCKYIYWNLKLNKVDERAKVLCVAVGKRRGWGWFYLGESLVNSSLIKGYVEDFSRVVGRLRVFKLTLMDALKMSGFKKIDLLKLDVEGSEGDVLEESTRALEEFDVEKIVVEIHEGYSSLKRLGKVLEERYRLIVVNDGETPHQSFLYALSRR
ncbi:MAG: FkbM family methyltransferase [Infirmifilum sp.]